MRVNGAFISSLKLLLFLLSSFCGWSSAFLSLSSRAHLKIKGRSRFCFDRVGCSAVRVWVELAEDGFVDKDENLMMGEVCLRAVKAFASHVPDDDGEEEDKRFLCAGALVKRPSPSNICDAWMADCLMDETNLQVQGAVQVLDDLFCYHLESGKNSGNLGETLSTFVVQSGRMESEYHCASYMAATSRGFKPLKEFLYNKHSRSVCWDHLDREEEDLDALIFDVSAIDRYSMDPNASPMAKTVAGLLAARMDQLDSESI